MTTKVQTKKACDICHRPATFLEDGVAYCEFHSPLPLGGMRVAEASQPDESHKEIKEHVSFLIELATKLEKSVQTSGYGQRLRIVAGVLLSGTERSKRIAKHSHLDSSDFPPGKGPDDKTVWSLPQGNHVGRLNELTQNLGLEPPIYDFSFNGLGHDPVCSCTAVLDYGAGKLTVTTKAPSKNQAKRLAALKILQQMQSYEGEDA